METRRRKIKESNTAGKTGKQRKSYGYQGRATLSMEDALKALEISSDNEEDTGETSSSSGVAMETGVIGPSSNSNPSETVENKAVRSCKVRQVVSGNSKAQRPQLGSEKVRKAQQRYRKENSEGVPLKSSGRQKTSRPKTKMKPRAKQGLRARHSSSEAVEPDSNGAVSSDESVMESFTGGTIVPECKIKKRALSGYKTKKTPFSKYKHKKAVSSVRVEEMPSPHSRKKNWRVHKLSNRGVLLRLPGASQQHKMRFLEGIMATKGRAGKSTRRGTWRKLDKEEVNVLDDSPDEEEINVLASPEPTSCSSSFRTPEDMNKSNKDCTLACDPENKSCDDEHASPDKEQESAKVCHWSWSNINKGC